MGHLLNALGRRPAPRLLLGDLNLGPETVGPACEGAGLTLVDSDQPSFPAEEPEYRIDHIAVVGMTVDSVSVVEGPVSDHRAVIAELEVAVPY